MDTLKYTVIESKVVERNLPWIFGAGKAANIPAANEVKEGSFYFETDTMTLKSLNPDATPPWGVVHEFGGE